MVIGEVGEVVEGFRWLRMFRLLRGMGNHLNLSTI
jgi:hypothetical protein